MFNDTKPVGAERTKFLSDSNKTGKQSDWMGLKRANLNNFW